MHVVCVFVSHFRPTCARIWPSPMTRESSPPDTRIRCWVASRSFSRNRKGLISSRSTPLDLLIQSSTWTEKQAQFLVTRVRGKFPCVRIIVIALAIPLPHKRGGIHSRRDKCHDKMMQRDACSEMCHSYGILGEPDLSDSSVPRHGHHVKFQPVAGGQDAGLLDVRVGAQLLDCTRPLGLRHGKLLPQLHRCVVNGEAYADDGALGLRGIT